MAGARLARRDKISKNSKRTKTLSIFDSFNSCDSCSKKISVPSVLSVWHQWSIRVILSRLAFRLPATSELRPSGLTMAAWLNEKGSQPRLFRVIRAIRVRKKYLCHQCYLCDINGQWTCHAFRASLYLCALFRGGLYPLLNSVQRYARACETPSVFDDFFCFCQNFFAEDSNFRPVKKIKKIKSHVFCVKTKKI